MCSHQIGADGWEKPRDNFITRYRLRRIVRALGIKKLYAWQQLYAFGKLDDLPKGRGIGKTTACLVKMAMWYKGVIDRRDITFAGILNDPDYYSPSSKNRAWHRHEIEKLYFACRERGIKIFRMVPDQTRQRRRWWRP